MAKSLFSMCINHPHVDATARCKQCGKPLCDDCKILGPTGYFCSDACKDQHQRFTERVEAMDRREPAPGKWRLKLRKFMVKGAVLALALIVLALTAYVLGFDVPYMSRAVAWTVERVPFL